MALVYAVLNRDNGPILPVIDAESLVLQLSDVQLIVPSHCSKNVPAHHKEISLSSHPSPWQFSGQSGTLYITTHRVMWFASLADGTRGLAFDLPSLSSHALTRDASIHSGQVAVCRLSSNIDAMDDDEREEAKELASSDAMNNNKDIDLKQGQDNADNTVYFEQFPSDYRPTTLYFAIASKEDMVTLTKSLVDVMNAMEAMIAEAGLQGPGLLVEQEEDGEDGGGDGDDGAGEEVDDADPNVGAMDESDNKGAEDNDDDDDEMAPSFTVSFAPDGTVDLRSMGFEPANMDNLSREQQQRLDMWESKFVTPPAAFSEEHEAEQEQEQEQRYEQDGDREG